MSRTSYIVSALLILFIIIISIFSYRSEESVMIQAGVTAEKTFFSEDIPEDNYQGEHFTFYLPNPMEVEEVDNFNAIIEYGDQTLIVFYNTLEDDLSQLNFNAAKTDDAVLLETFTDDEKFGYIRLLPEGKDEEYEIQVGVGGVKVTTYTTKGEVITDSENLMKMALSIVK
ncbi:hypothetical protein [Ornithinibacillus californiensis]|uniref:hypothetical protein n=1 Tax=Ornithinibacillus californiensis TaxID=161536 RepID=UPI00064DEF06|nr:hypothetical protein [Ornithinibacillus californiensis]